MKYTISVETIKIDELRTEVRISLDGEEEILHCGASVPTEALTESTMLLVGDVIHWHRTGNVPERLQQVAERTMQGGRSEPSERN